MKQMQTTNIMSRDEFYARKKEMDRLEVLKVLEEEKAEKRQLQRENSLLGKRYYNVNFTNTKIPNQTFKNAFDKCKQYCDDYKKNIIKGLGMYLFGDVGVGKTHLMACVVNDLIDKDKECLVTSFIEINKKIKASYNGIGSELEIINELSKVDLLFIDDFGTEIVQRNGEDAHMQGVIYDIINNRYNDLKPTIFTSNHSLQQLINDRGVLKKTIDRINETSIYVINLASENQRLKKTNGGMGI